MTDKDKLALAVKSLRRIAECEEGDLHRYCKLVDAIAVATLIQLELADD